MKSLICFLYISLAFNGSAFSWKEPVDFARVKTELQANATAEDLTLWLKNNMAPAAYSKLSVESQWLLNDLSLLLPLRGIRYKMSRVNSEVNFSAVINWSEIEASLLRVAHSELIDENILKSYLQNPSAAEESKPWASGKDFSLFLKSTEWTQNLESSFDRAVVLFDKVPEFSYFDRSLVHVKHLDRVDLAYNLALLQKVRFQLASLAAVNLNEITDFLKAEKLTNNFAGGSLPTLRLKDLMAAARDKKYTNLFTVDLTMQGTSEVSLLARAYGFLKSYFFYMNKARELASTDYDGDKSWPGQTQIETLQKSDSLLTHKISNRGFLVDIPLFFQQPSKDFKSFFPTSVDAKTKKYSWNLDAYCAYFRPQNRYRKVSFEQCKKALSVEELLEVLHQADLDRFLFYSLFF